MIRKNNLEKLYLFRAKFVMNLLGVWLSPKNETIKKKVYRFAMISLQFLFLFFQLVYIVEVWGDLDAVSQASYLLFTQACLCFKIAVFMFNGHLLIELIDQMNADILKPESKSHEIILKTQSARIKGFLLIFMIASQLTCALWALKPLLDDTDSRQFPFQMWMPVNTESYIQYILGYVSQWMTISMSAFMYFGVDSVTLSMVIFACAQLMVIMEKLLNLKPIPEGDRMLRRNGLKSPVFDENYDTFINCIKRHQAVVSFIKLLENTYHTYLFFQLSGSVGLICMSALTIQTVDWKSMQFFSILTYVLSMIMQLYICCWCGHELTATSEELFVVMYKCQWYEQDIRFQKALRFAMMRMFRPMVFRAGHYIHLSRPTFVTILRMSYSYFAVLQQTNKDKSF